MYRVGSPSGDNWTIIDESDRLVLVADLHQCEGWLDSRENRAVRASRLAEWLRAARALLHRRSPRWI